MPFPIEIQPINPAHYYDVRFVATLRGLHLCTVYQSLSGVKRAALPRPTRFGRGVKFLGQHILDFIEEHGGTVAQASASPDQSSSALASVAKAKAPRGRPRNAGLNANAGAAA